MKNKFFAFLLSMVLCLSAMMPVVYAAENDSANGSETAESMTEVETSSENNPDLPKVYDGAAIGSNSRRQYTEETRPADASPLNSVVDNPDYGNEFNFLTITNATTGEAWRAGTMELVAGDQYLVEVYCRHDGTDSYRCLQYGSVMLNIDMPYELGAGEIQNFGARIVTGTSINIYASIRVVAREGVSIQYVDGTAKSTGSNGETEVDYEELFGAGADMPRNSRRLTVGEYRLVSFVIQVVADDSVPAVDQSLDYMSLLSAPGTGFEVPVIDNGNATDGAVESAESTDEAETEQSDNSVLVLVVAVIASLAIGCCVGVAVTAKKRRGS